MNAVERFSLGFLMVLAAFSLACGLLDDDATNFVEEVDVPFSVVINADELCPEDVECDREEPVRATADQELEPIEFATDIDVVEKTGKKELRDYAGAFRSIKITRVKYDLQQAADNELTFDLPETTVYLGPLGSESIEDEGVVELATLPTFDAGVSDSGSVDATSQGQAASAELFKDLKVAALARAQPVVKKDQPLPPSGEATLKITIVVEFTANPQDAL